MTLMSPNVGDRVPRKSPVFILDCFLNNWRNCSFVQSNPSVERNRLAQVSSTADKTRLETIAYTID